MISSQGQAPELHVQVDGLHHLAEGERRRSTVYFGEAPVSAAGVRRGREAERPATATCSTPTTRRTSRTSGTGTRRRRPASTAAATSAPTSTPGPRPGPRSRAADRRPSDRPGRRPPGRRLGRPRHRPMTDRTTPPPLARRAAARLRRLAAALYRHPRVQLGLLLAAPLGWLVIAYLGSLAPVPHHVVLVGRPAHAATSSRRRRSTTTRDPDRRRSTGRSRSGRSSWRRSSR